MKMYAKLSTSKRKRGVREAQDIVTLMGDSGADVDHNKAKGEYGMPDIFHEVRFANPDYSLEDGEWFYVELNDSDKPVVLGSFLQIVESPSSLNETRIQKDQISEVECIIGTDGRKMVFTKITPKYRIYRKYIITSLGAGDRGVFIERYDNSIDFDPQKIDAYFDGDSKLYFKNYSTVRGVFNGMERFYRPANLEEIESFLNWDMLDVANEEVTPQKVSRHRLLSSRIASIMDDESLDINEEETKSRVISAIRNIGEKPIGVKLNSDKVIISSKSDLRKICDVLLGCYYKSPISGENLRTKASIKI